ncbi:MAG: hypothetical protein U0528_17165 [Anaerolineae bacterium]
MTLICVATHWRTGTTVLHCAERINNANSIAGDDTITFDPVVFSTPQTINLTRRRTYPRTYHHRYPRQCDGSS